MLVITNPIPVKDEIAIIHALFESGLELLHVRKPNYSLNEMQFFITEIQSKYHSKLVLHQHHDLTVDFEINRLHYTEKNRNELNTLANIIKTGRCVSTSVHSMATFNSLPDVFEYAFLSPIFESISKPGYFSQKNHFASIKERTNFSTKLVGLGGIQSKNIKEVLENGFDDIALLGSIWHATNPIKEFKKCQQIVQLY